MAGRRPRLGIRRHPLGEVWRTMIRHCHDPRHPKFKLYGATGIGVCARWRD
jgi:hypothetical protein